MYPTGWNGQYGNPGPYGALVTYGSLNLTEFSPPQSFAEPLEIEEVKAFLGDVDDDDPLADLNIPAMIVAARSQAEIFQGRDLVRKQWDLSHDYWMSYRVELRDPLVSVDLVQYRDSNGNLTTLVEDADYIVDTSKHPGVLAPAYNKTWPTFSPWPSSAVLIRYTSGFSPQSAWWLDDGARVKIGMRMLIASWYEKRIPFATGAGVVMEYPIGMTACLSSGALTRAR